MKRNISLPDVSPLASRVIKIGLPLISLVFVYILLILITTPAESAVWLVHEGYSTLEAAFMSFTLILCGAVVIDLAEKNKENT